MVEAPAPADLSAAAQVPALPLQVDLLQLPPEVPAPGAPALRGVLDRLFAHWLSLPDTAALLASLVPRQGGHTAGTAPHHIRPSDQTLLLIFVQSARNRI
jgi:serine/threonine-protein phosphatase 2A regulatory subunit B''